MCVLIYYCLIFIFGLLAGSFLNCLIYRLKESQSFLLGRSYCPNCKHILNWWDLIPILSFIFLRGKCKYCQKPISWQYPLVEFFTAVSFVLIYYFFPIILDSCFLILISCFLIVIFVYDLKHFIIPDKVIFPAIGITFLYQLFKVLDFGHLELFGIRDLGFGVFEPLIFFIVTALGAAAFFLFIVLFSKGRWMGAGDIGLAFLMGLILGWPNILVALFSAFFLGAIIGIGLIAFGKRTLKSEIPFGPFLVTGTFLALFFGEKVINYYLNLFL